MSKKIHDLPRFGIFQNIPNIYCRIDKWARPCLYATIACLRAFEKNQPSSHGPTPVPSHPRMACSLVEINRSINHGQVGKLVRNLGECSGLSDAPPQWTSSPVEYSKSNIFSNFTSRRHSHIFRRETFWLTASI